MTLELWNTFATLGTFIVIAATAIAALVQLRHLRAGNQVSAMTSVGSQFDDRTFREALQLALPNIDSAVDDDDFRRYDLAVGRRAHLPPVPQGVIDLRRAALLVGNFYEELGILVKNGAIDRDLVLDRWSANTCGSWYRMARYVSWIRKAQNTRSVWENFEYLTVLSEDWLRAHPDGVYPQGVRRLELPESPPIPAVIANS
jgi:hypothetical protein